MLLVFKRAAECTVESVVQTVSGPFIHVDMIPDISTEPFQIYTSYMFERFGRYTMTSGLPYTGKAHSGIYLELSADERARASEFLDECVTRNVPYNFSDLMACVITGQYTPLWDAHPTLPSSLYCSQAVVLCLRHAVTDKESALGKALSKTNSRFTSPSALHSILMRTGCAREVDMEPPDAAPF